MAKRLVNVDRDILMPLSVDLRECVLGGDLVHFVIEAVDLIRLPSIAVNRRRRGSERYPPQTMLPLLVYCYSIGVLSSRRIERATYRDIAVPYLTGDTHRDRDKTCAFGRQNSLAVKEAFVDVVQRVSEMKVPEVGTVCVDSVHIRADAIRVVRLVMAQQLSYRLVTIDVVD